MKTDHLKMLSQPSDSVRVFVRFQDGSEIEPAHDDHMMILRLMHDGAFCWVSEQYGKQMFLILSEPPRDAIPLL